MAFDYDLFRVVDVKNPSNHCTEIYFSDGKDNELRRTTLVIFEQQVKYIITEEYDDHKKVKIYIIDDEDPIVIDFHPEEYQLYEAFFMSMYNKNI